MPLDSTAALNQIDATLGFWAEARKRSKHDDLSDLKDADLAELVTMLTDAVQRFAPPGSAYRQKAELVTTEHGMGNLHTQQGSLYGILKALRNAYATGYLLTVQELVHADLFADFLEMADYLIGEGYKDAAAVIGGSVREGSLRNLCVKNGVAADVNGHPKKASAMNDDLVKGGVYTKLDQKGVTAWLDLRNKAAHGDFSAYDKAQVELYLRGIRDFLGRYPA
ncbi:MAG: hypothetical protein K2X87_14485 [Gemmataceae bacterium]|nr:hypothetical protein [Gemmataceae bacterium]